MPEIRWRERLAMWAHGLKQDALTLWFALRHPGTPLAAKALAFVVVAYALSPIDLIPDFIPVLGYLDEVVLLPGLIWLALRLLPADVLAACRERALAWMAAQGRQPAMWLGAAAVLALWVGAGLALWRWLAG